MKHKHLNLSIIGGWHVHASDFAHEITESVEGRLISIWDHDQERGRSLAEKFNCHYEQDLHRILSDEEIVGVVVTTETTRHREICLAALAAKKHILLEKVLAASSQEAELIAAAATSSDSVFLVALRYLNSGLFTLVRETVESEVLGQIRSARVVVSHDRGLRVSNQNEYYLPDSFLKKEAAGGGVLIDLGAHPIYLLLALFGAPIEIKCIASLNDALEVDLTSVTTMRFRNGEIGVAESSIVSARTPLTVELIGTKGSFNISAGNDNATLKVSGDTKSIPVPSNGPSSLKEFLHRIDTNFNDNAQLLLAVQLTKVIEEAYTNSNLAA